MHVDEILAELWKHGDPEAVAGMARFGIQGKDVYGVSIPTLRTLAKSIGKDHQLAEGLWQTGVHEARILASMVDLPNRVTEDQMERWVVDVDSWDVCDQCCNNLFKKTVFAYSKTVAWCDRDEEFVKRAGFVLMAVLAVFDKEAPAATFEPFFPLIVREATDERNFVKKAVNWALRQIGKRNLALNARAIDVARQIQAINSKSARWIAKDALRELTSPAVQVRLKNKK
jgi:3-methyladenine DNA glycosylase AlkD